MSETKRPRRTFTPELKYQLIQLYKDGKRKSEIMKEHDVGYSTLSRWIKEEESSNLLKEKDEFNPKQEEVDQLKKQNKQLLMQNDTLIKTMQVLANNLYQKDVGY